MLQTSTSMFIPLSPKCEVGSFPLCAAFLPFFFFSWLYSQGIVGCAGFLPPLPPNNLLAQMVGVRTLEFLAFSKQLQYLSVNIPEGEG